VNCESVLKHCSGGAVLKQERYVFKYYIGDLLKKSKSTDNNSSSGSGGGSSGSEVGKVEKTKDMEFEEAVRDLKISWIGKSVETV